MPVAAFAFPLPGNTLVNQTWTIDAPTAFFTRLRRGKAFRQACDDAGKEAFEKSHNVPSLISNPRPWMISGSLGFSSISTREEPALCSLQRPARPLGRSSPHFIEFSKATNTNSPKHRCQKSRYQQTNNKYDRIVPRSPRREGHE
jgi:hypothetical protein